MLAAPHNVAILRALGDGRKQLAELRHEVGLPAQTTLRAQLNRLTKIGAVEKQRRNRFPGVLEYDQTTAGRDLLSVADALERWLAAAPDGSIPLGGNAARAAIKALTEGWSTTMLRALAAGALSLTELDNVIGTLSYPSLERRLSAMRVVGQVVATEGNGRGTPYAVTDWLRRGVAPLATACRWERRYQPQVTAPVGRLDVEAAFLLAVPRLSLSPGYGGTCRLAAETRNGKPRLAGVTVNAANGAVNSCTTRLDGTPDSWALGSIAGWLDAVIDHDLGRLELGGERRLAEALLEAIHRTQFEVPGKRLHPIRP